VRSEKNPDPQPSTLNPQLYLQPPTLDGQSKSFTIRHSLLAIRCRFTNRYSPVARLKSALSFFVTDYGLKSVAWIVFLLRHKQPFMPLALASG
jgi:hypothetical protein